MSQKKQLPSASNPIWDGRYPSVGKKIVKNYSKPASELVKEFEDCFVPSLSGYVGVMYTMDGSIRPAYKPMRSLVGTAFTVKVPPGDNLMVKLALRMAGPGDIVVVDARGQTNYCCGGGGMIAAAKAQGIKGMVVDGAYRDIKEIQDIDFPMFFKGTAPATGPKRGPGEINVPVCCGGVIVHPGDIIVGDETEGVVVIPKQYAERVAKLVRDENSRAWHTANEWQWDELVKRSDRDDYYEEVLDMREYEYIETEE